MEQELREFYKKVVQCPMGASCSLLGIENNPQTGIIPRGFYTQFYEPKRILVVAINPGRMEVNNDEAERYRKSEDCEAEQHKIIEEFASSGEQFQRYLQDAVRTVLRLSPDEDIYAHVGFTNLVKCQCSAQYGKFSELWKKSRSNAERLIEECFKRWFMEELGLLHPRLILAYSSLVKYFLMIKSGSRLFTFPGAAGEK